jgi:hypothetical protein
MKEIQKLSSKVEKMDSKVEKVDSEVAMLKDNFPTRHDPCINSEDTPSIDLTELEYSDSNDKPTDCSTSPMPEKTY